MNNKQINCPPCQESVKKSTDDLLERDDKVLNDDLSPPTRRIERHNYPSRRMSTIVNVPTQGMPDNYHLIGNLINSDKSRVIKLFGRQHHPGSNKYEYYGITTDDGQLKYKLPIKTTNDKELQDGDEITISMLGEDFTFYEHEYDAPRYNPYLFA
tara:strand:- start:71 stop:535 length:465 start_codon:yes stop_codon:yes gene_type:complete